VFAKNVLVFAENVFVFARRGYYKLGGARPGLNGLGRAKRG
jgi:hypothetical protein